MSASGRSVLVKLHEYVPALVPDTGAEAISMLPSDVTLHFSSVRPGESSRGLSHLSPSTSRTRIVTMYAP